ncbi:MAG TPA: enoyl-CoA hydratase-related protein [Actinomycetota bacterium]|jgi:enoyl-CoA hydratase|nr:enoyl-CoA hydratase-related protein [Actinomycetota bacterium]
MSPTVAYETSGPVATLTIDREERRNAINPEVVEALDEGLARAEADAAVRVVVLTGRGDKAFCAGGDLGGMDAQGAVRDHASRARVGRLFSRMRTSRLPIVARVNGHALAGGFGLMLACDQVVCADDVELGMPEIDIGLWPFMVTAVVQRDIPRKVALDLMLSGRRIAAAEGERWGFVNRVAPRADLDAAVDELTGVLASKSPVVVELGKRSFYRSEDLAFDDAVEYLSGMLTLCLQTEDTAEGIGAFFQKRPPEWKGR